MRRGILNSLNEHLIEQPELLLARFFHLLVEGDLPGPILDLAAGTCRHAIFVAQAGLPVQCYDISEGALARGRERAARLGVWIETRCVDLEQPGSHPLLPARFGAVLVFHYLYRPLMAAIKEAMRPGAILIYETYTEDQAAFSRPRNPDHLLKKGELRKTFHDWVILHCFVPPGHALSW
jgi:tellurite methyltransferase